MNDESFQKTLEAALSLGGISALAATCRVVLSPDERTFSGWIGRFVLGIFAGLMVGFSIEDLGWSRGWEQATVCAVALSAKEIILTIIKAAETLRDLAPAIVKKLLKKIIK